MEVLQNQRSDNMSESTRTFKEQLNDLLRTHQASISYDFDRVDHNGVRQGEVIRIDWFDDDGVHEMEVDARTHAIDVQYLDAEKGM